MTMAAGQDMAALEWRPEDNAALVAAGSRRCTVDGHWWAGATLRWGPLGAGATLRRRGAGFIPVCYDGMLYAAMAGYALRWWPSAFRVALNCRKCPVLCHTELTLR